MLPRGRCGVPGHGPGMHDHVMAIAEPTFPARGRCGSDFALLSPLAGVGVECGGRCCDAIESIETGAAGVAFLVMRWAHFITDWVVLSIGLCVYTGRRARFSITIRRSRRHF